MHLFLNFKAECEYDFSACPSAERRHARYPADSGAPEKCSHV